MSKTIDEQIKIIEDQMRSRRGRIEHDLTTMFEHMKMPNDMNTHMVQRVTEDLMEQMRQSAILILLDMLTHPKRFEMFAQLAGQLKERSDEGN